MGLASGGDLEQDISCPQASILPSIQRGNRVGSISFTGDREEQMEQGL